MRFIQDTTPKSHWVSIKAYTKFGNGQILESFYWGDLRFEIRTKYSWYFKYRAALLQVKYPKSYIDFKWGKETAKEKTKSQILRNRLIRKKGKITEVRNKLEKAESSWNQLFPIEEYPLYKKAGSKLERLIKEREALEIELTKV